MSIVRIAVATTAAALAWSARAGWNNVVPFIHADEVHANGTMGQRAVVAGRHAARRSHRHTLTAED
jgi:hypothetical protein